MKRDAADAERVLASLKDFQRATVDYVFHRLWLAEDQVKIATAKADAQDFEAANAAKAQADKTRELIGLFGAVSGTGTVSGTP